MSKQTDLLNLTDAISVAASGNVGIGTATPNKRLVLETTANNDGIRINGSGGQNNPALILTNTDTSAGFRMSYNEASDLLGFDRTDASGNFSSALMAIDSSGNVLVGTTSTSSNIAGHGFLNGDVAYHTRAGNTLLLNRLTSDGDIAIFRKDGTTVGSIGSRNAGSLDTSYIQFYAGSSNSVGLGGTSSLAILPILNGATSDNLVDMGLFSVRFDDIYATNGTIQTSDRNEKEAIASLTPTEMLVAARLSSSFKNFKWKDAVAEKGDAARMHSGIIAQDVQDAFTAEGLDASDYAMFISGTWWETQTDVPAVEAVAEVVDEEGNVVTEAVEAKDAYTRTDTYHTLEEAPEGATERTRLGIRYPELLAFVAAYSDQRFLTIEARLTALEAT